MSTSFLNSNAVNPETVLINEPMISSICSETYSVLFKEASQLGDLETEMDKKPNNLHCLKTHQKKKYKKM